MRCGSSVLQLPAQPGYFVVRSEKGEDRARGNRRNGGKSGRPEGWNDVGGWGLETGDGRQETEKRTMKMQEKHAATYLDIKVRTE